MGYIVAVGLTALFGGLVLWGLLKPVEQTQAQKEEGAERRRRWEAEGRKK